MLVSLRVSALSEREVGGVVVVPWRGALLGIVLFIDGVEPPKATVYLLRSTQDTRVGVNELVRLCRRAEGFAIGVDRVVRILEGVQLLDHELIVNFHLISF